MRSGKKKTLSLHFSSSLFILHLCGICAFCVPRVYGFGKRSSTGSMTVNSLCGSAWYQ